MTLTLTQVREALPRKKIYRLRDQNSLYLEVRPSGRKFWRLYYRDDSGVQKTNSLGEFPDVGLLAARRLGDIFRAKLHSTKAVVKSSTKAATLSDVAVQWFEARKDSWVKSHADRVWARIERDVLPTLGDKTIRSIKPVDILNVLRQVEERGALDISKRLRQNIESIYEYAIVIEAADKNPAIGLNSALKAMPKVQHMAALEFSDLPSFFVRFNRSGVEQRTKLALRLVMLTCTRTNEIRSAEWRDIKGDLWSIPAHKMKRERDHLIPLSRQAIEVLSELKRITKGDLVVDIQQNSMIHAIYKMGYKGKLTVHGFRSIFSTHANDSGKWSPDAIERALAHVPNNKVRSAYNRALYLDERRKMLQWWADQLDRQIETAELMS